MAACQQELLAIMIRNKTSTAMIGICIFTPADRQIQLNLMQLIHDSITVRVQSAPAWFNNNNTIIQMHCYRLQRHHKVSHISEWWILVKFKGLQYPIMLNNTICVQQRRHVQIDVDSMGSHTEDIDRGEWCHVIGIIAKENQCTKSSSCMESYLRLRLIRK